MKLSSAAFWDIDFDQLDFERDSVFIIERVFTRGLWQDIIAIRKYYGDERLKKEVIKAGNIDKKTMSLCCILFNLRKEDFSCYIKTRSIPELWNY